MNKPLKERDFEQHDKRQKSLKEKIEEGFNILEIFVGNLYIEEDYKIDQHLNLKDLIRQEPNPLIKGYYYVRLKRLYKLK